MMKTWVTVPMAQICAIKSGKSDTKDAVPDGPYVFFDRSRTVKRSSRFLYDCEALIIPGEGTEFLPKHFVGKFDLHQRAYALFDFSERVDVRFLHYYLHYRSDYFPAVAVGATAKSLRLRHFEQLPVVLPARSEQQRIVNILDEAFGGIATAKVNAETNLQNARAIFESYLKSVFTRRGEGWSETTVGEQLTLQRGFDITKGEQKDGEVPVVSSGGIKSYHNKAMVTGPGVVIGRKGTLGSVFYLKGDFWPHDTTLWVKDFKRNNPRFIYYLFEWLEVKHLDSGMANPALNRNQVHRLRVTWPSVRQQAELVETLDALNEETQRLAAIYKHKLDELEALKRSLFHRAFTAQL